MKKEYVKPYIVVESFQLDAAIAGSCADDNLVPIGHYARSCSAIEEIEIGYFGSTICAVNLYEDYGEGGDGNDGLCYHAMDVAALFLAS